jgi:hypothetical protein
LPRYRHLHFATHGHLESEIPQLSGLAVANGEFLSCWSCRDFIWMPQSGIPLRASFDAADGGRNRRDHHERRVTLAIPVRGVTIAFITDPERCAVTPARASGL